jgi:hypothetical protein
MARKSLGTLTLDLIAKVGGFEAGLDKASRKSQKTSKQIEKYSNQIGKALTAASATGIAAMTALVGSTANGAREIKNLSMLADATPQQFQKITYAAKRYNIEQEKVSDILKDINDRIGDFIQTGGGPMADFFENIAPKVGVTADQFARLSGPEALQLYVKSLEDAGVSQKDMTFYMEAIASDATALLPLLRDNGRELKNLGDEAERTGNVFSDLEFQQLENIRRGMDELTGAATGMKNELVIGALPAVEDLVDLLSDESTLESAKSLGGAIVTSMNFVVKAIDGAVKVTQFLAEELAAFVHGPAFDDIPRLTEQLEDQNEALEAQEERLKSLRQTPGIIPKEVIANEEHRLKKLREAYQTTFDLIESARTAQAAGAGAGSGIGTVDIPEGTSGAAGGNIGSGGGDDDEYGKLRASLDERFAIQLEYQEKLKEIRQAYAAGEIELAEKVELEKLAAEQRVREEYEFDSQREQYDSHLELYQEFQEEQTRLAEQEAKKRAQVEEQAQSAITSMHHSTWQAAAGLLNTFAGESKAAALASIAITKGLAMAQTIANTASAEMAAMAVDPTGVMAARVAVMGKINLGIIAATGLAQAHQITSGGGGSVGTGGYSSSGTNPPVSPNSDPTFSEDLEDNRRAVQINFNAPVNGLDADQIARSIKDHLESTDFVLIESATRNGRLLSSR